MKNRLLILVSLISITCVKILCFPAYKSTDFSVHRNWKAVTRHVPLKEWYFDDVNGTTVHTLDYPPAFAYFEYLLATNKITEWLLESGILSERCLALLPDTNNDVDHACVVFMRSTVVLSDMLLWWGAWLLSKTVSSSNPTTSFLLIVFNPGLLWLDHVHFQYNGMLLGILLASCAFLLKPCTTTNVSLASILYILLVSMKHLYIGLAPLYLVFLLKHYCCSGSDKFSLQRFVYLAVLVVSTLLILWWPFLEIKQLQQVLQRLFPFGRGLCHDYPAANVWALYLVANKVVAFVSQRVWGVDVSLPEITPATTALLLLLSLLPGLWIVWNSQQQKSLIMAVVYCSFCTFMLSWHVHEKAIMTCMLPLTCIAMDSVEHARLFVRTNAVGLFGLFPLLFRVDELPLKATTYICYMAFVVYVLQQHFFVGVELLTRVDYVGIFFLASVATFLEVLHPLLLDPWMQALPLLVTSTACAIGLISCWMESLRLLWLQQTTVIVKDKQV